MAPWCRASRRVAIPSPSPARRSTRPRAAPARLHTTPFPGSPAELDEYWQLTLRFLQIARDEWPKLLSQRGGMEPAARRDRLIAMEADRLRAHTDGPVIAAGSTGSMPATAELIATIGGLPHG